MGIVTGIVAALPYFGVKLFEALSGASFMDAGIFLFLAFFIHRFSRIAAIAGLLLYVGEQVMMIKISGVRFSIVPILFTFYFVSGVRGAFIYHELKGTETPEEKTVPPQVISQGETIPVKKPKRMMIFSLIFILLAGVLGGGYFFLAKKKGSVSSGENFSGTSADLEIQEPAAGERTFRLKDGKTVTGLVLMEDEVYYTVETSGGRQEIVIKEDIA